MRLLYLRPEPALPPGPGEPRVVLLLERVRHAADGVPDLAFGLAALAVGDKLAVAERLAGC